MCVHVCESMCMCACVRLCVEKGKKRGEGKGIGATVELNFGLKSVLGILTFQKGVKIFFFQEYQFHRLIQFQTSTPCRYFLKKKNTPYAYSSIY